MDLTAWTLYLLIAAGIIGAALLHYRLREPAGTGRGLLAGLRGLAVAAVVLLLFNPRVPTSRGASPAVLALVDGSASMAMPADGGTAWEAAAAALDSLAPDRVVVVGGRRDTTPAALDSRLGPALRAAVEAGPGRVVVFTDGAVEDGRELRNALEAASGASLRVVGSAPRFNAGLTGVEAPGWVQVGETVEVEVTMAAVGTGAPDSVDVALRRGDREVARQRVPVPVPGREVSVALSYTPGTAAPEPVRLDAVLVHGGSVPDDDVRSVYVEVVDAPAGVALVSLAPGQEPRFLLPVLARATGLPVRGWAAVAPGRWLRIGQGADAGRVETEEAPRRAVQQADVVVAHGFGAEAPAWLDAAVGGATRVLVFPGDEAVGVPFDPGPARVADWYIADAVPASPVAALMAGGATTGLPPLQALRPASSGDFWAPLEARAGRRGEPWPVLAAGEVNGRRVAVALGDGYWRWAFAGEEGRAFYDRFWSAVGGWLAEPDGAGAGTGIEPVERVVARGGVVEWRIPGPADSVAIRMVRIAPVALGPGDGEGPAEWSETVGVVDGVARLPGVRPGHYRYTVSARMNASADAGSGVRTGTGEVTVSGYTAEFTRPVTVGSYAGSGAAARGGRSVPLRGTPWGYVAVLALLSVEWVLRRRWGLR